MATAISISGLVKSFGPTRALDGLELEVRTGEVHGFLGPNGAGKTTTIRVLLGLLRADAGRAELLGGDPWRDAVALHRRLAYVPGDVALWPALSGGEIIDLLGRLRGGLDRRRRDELLELFDLDPHKKARAYSKGNRQKVALVAALASDVELLLDEPHLGAGAADGGPLPRGHRRRAPQRAHGAAVQPHPGRGRSPVRPGQHRAGRSHRRIGHPGRAAPPHPDLDPGRAGRTAGRPGRAHRGPRAAGRGDQGPLPGGRRPSGRGAAPPVRGRGAQPDQPAPDPGGAVPAPLQTDEQVAAAGQPAREGRGRERVHRHRPPAAAGRPPRADGGTAWVLGLFVFALSQAASIVSLYPTQADLDRLARTAEDIGANPAVVALQGPAYDASTYGGAMVQLPAVWVMAAVGAALSGLAPRLVVGLTWAVLAAVLFVTMFGEPLQLSQPLLDASPFVHLPRLPAAAFTATPLVWLLAVAALLAAAGLAAFRRRDLVSTA